ncbi:ABC transporter substrate-binding protein [Amycolatopsis sp. FDAARGOS 1241]|uniref:ABC transporter substrate-binding protein n=1 Tax=Amycolatopsis sp. FDAARGOS 1241 TaxID=2778070 RepID=UPI00194F187F|nr:ABC transporter substrate-binding protein [Amycolatopsis sp. FDAARGOS 1241]QRP50375.1 ABC transporter substrate-binding protein [Amycolatopsis sp. FDAARGOS 1241]
MRHVSFSLPGKPVSRRAALAGGAAALLTTACGAPQGLHTVNGKQTITVLAFRAPSLGAFLPAVIKAKRFDDAHGLHIDFAYATPDNYNTEFASGHYQVGASAALLSEALRRERQVDVTYLFNLFDYFTAVVTSDPSLHTLTDLRGHSLAAATGTTNHAMFEWFARQGGLDLHDAELINQTTAGLSTMALIGRANAVEIWEPAYSSLVATRPDIRTLDIGLGEWQRRFGTGQIPYLGLAAHSDWAKANPGAVATLYRIYSTAAQWTTANPDAAAAIIAKATPRGKAGPLAKLIEDPSRLRLHLAPAAQLATGIEAVLEAGRETGYLTDTPPANLVYQEL